MSRLRQDSVCDCSPRLLALGDTAWTLEFGEKIDPEIHGLVMALNSAILERRREATPSVFSGILDVVPTFRSLTVHYDPWRSDGEALGEALLALSHPLKTLSVAGRCWRLPVCFDEDFAPDLDELARAKGLPHSKVIQALTESCFQVYMIGFMPGFPYMGGLPEQLEMPRLASPRKRVPERSFAIAGRMCAVYPWESPGGWRLLGRTPIAMFSAEDEQAPSLLASGDRVYWHAIDRKTFTEMEAASRAGALPRAHFLEGAL